MKQKTGRKLLGVLLTLALVLGLMPGMGLSAKADADADAWTSIKMDGTQLKKGGQNWGVEDDGNIDGIKKKLSLPAGNYRLDSDIQTEGAIVVNSGTVNFDLNGHGIMASGGFNVFYIIGNGNLSITDSNPSTVHGYTISNPSNTNGAGLATVHSTKQNDDTEFKGGFITGGKKTDGGIWGGAIQLKAGTCTVTDCTLIGNNASCGGAVNVQGNGSLSMSGTAIIGNTSDDHGGGVYNQGSSGTVTLTNCTIKYNYAGKNGGGGVRVYKSITTIIDGCTITDNACSGGTHGGGICVGGLEDSDSAMIKIKGDISIKNNFCSDTEENLYLSDKNGGSFVYVDGKLSDTASIGVTMSGPGVFTKTADENKEAWNNVSKFTSDNASYFVSKNTDGQLFIGTPISSVAVTGITAPVATETLDTEAATSTGNVSLGTVTWNPAVASAAYATEYTATVIATANVNYAFTDNATATVNGQTATVTKNQDGTLTISYTFTKTPLNPVTITPTNKEVTYSADGITIPVEGMFDITEGAGTATYSVENGTGEGTYDATAGKLTVTKCGTFTVKVSTAETETHAAGTETSATLTVNKATALTPAVDNFTYTAPGHYLTYDGTPKTATVVPNEGITGMGQVTVKYYSDEECDAENIVESPTDAGEYYVGITVAEGDNYSAVSDVLHDSNWKFTINKATPTATNFTYNAPSDLTYNDTAKIATVNTKDNITGMGNVTVKYYSDQRCTTEVTPTNVGTYYVGITLSEGNNYLDASSALHDDDWSFTITKAAETAPAADTSNLIIDYSEETISANVGYEVAADNNGMSITNFSAILENGTPTVYIRKTASDNNHDPSAWVAVTLAARPDAPNGLSTENASNGGTADGKIKGTTAAMEYKQKDSEGEWTTAMAGETAVVPGTYIVRVKATDAAPHGKAAEVTVGSNYKALDDSTTVTIKKGESELSGVPVVDDVLTVSCEASDVTYQWYRGDEAISEASGTSYTVTKNDVGKAIKVVATQTKDSNGQEITGTKPTKESAATSAVVKKTPEMISADTAKSKAGINYQTEQATPDSGYEVSTDGTNKTESPISLTDIIDSESPKIYVRTAENDDTAVGAWVEVTIVARPDEPTGLTTESANTATSQDGKIKGTTEDMEYKLKGSEGAWTTATAGETLVASGTYLIRTKASSDKPVGKTAEVAVGSKEIILTDAQKPTAKTNLVFTNSKQALMNEPAENLPEGAKEIQYALGTKDAATQPYTSSIPTATDAGT